MKTEAPDFFDRIKDVKRLLVLDLGFLGDTIQLIPALRMIRKAMPDVQLEVMVAEHIQSIMEVTPWVDKVLGYPRFPKGPKWYQDLGRVWKLRRERYDAVINLNGSDRSSLLTWATGASLRLGRIPPKTASFWKYCYTHTVAEPFSTTPLFKQRCNCLKKSGFPGGEAAFGIEIPEKAFASVDAAIKGLGGFVHLSPFTTLDYKELPIPILAAGINRVMDKYPEFPWVVSCAPNDREREKLNALLALLVRRPRFVFPGTMNLVELAALISRSRLHVGGDSGAIHVAAMTGVPTLSWFRDYEAIDEWKPTGDQHITLVGKDTPEGLRGISAEAFGNAFSEVLLK